MISRLKKNWKPFNEARKKQLSVKTIRLELLTEKPRELKKESEASFFGIRELLNWNRRE